MLEIPMTTVESPFGTIRVVFPGENRIRLQFDNDYRCIEINRVNYHYSVDLEKLPNGNYDYPISEYGTRWFSYRNLSRAGSYGDYASDAAQKKFIQWLFTAFTQWLDLPDQQIRIVAGNIYSYNWRIESKLQEVKKQEQKLNDLKDELQKLKIELSLIK